MAKFLDETGLNQYNNGIANAIKDKLSHYATKAEVAGKVDNTVFNNYKTEVSGELSDIDDKFQDYYTGDEIDSKLEDKVDKGTGTNAVVTLGELNSKGYITSADMSSYATTTYVDSQDQYMLQESKQYTDSKIPTDIVTQEELNDQLSNYATKTTTNNIQSQVSTNTNDIKILKQTGGGSSNMIDLNNIYNWTKINSGFIVTHMGDNSDQTHSEYGRNFKTGIIYKRSSTEFSVTNHSVVITINGSTTPATKDFTYKDELQIWLEKNKEQYLDIPAIVNVNGLIIGDETVMDKVTWNNYIGSFTDNKTLIISGNKFQPQEITIYILPYNADYTSGSLVKTFVTASQCFTAVNEDQYVTSLGGKKGDISFYEPIGEEEEHTYVKFSYSEDGKLKGSIDHPSILDAIPIGAIVIWPSDTAPANFFLCDGSEIEQASYEALYNVIGNKFGDESTEAGKFKLPDMRNILQGMNYIIKY